MPVRNSTYFHIYLHIANGLYGRNGLALLIVKGGDHSGGLIILDPAPLGRDGIKLNKYLGLCAGTALFIFPLQPY